MELTSLQMLSLMEKNGTDPDHHPDRQERKKCSTRNQGADGRGTDTASRAV